MPITPEQFVRAWQESSTLAEVAKRLGLSQSSVASRGAYYRRKGVRLKKFASGKGRVDVAALNAIIDNGEAPKRARKSAKE